MAEKVDLVEIDLTDVIEQVDTLTTSIVELEKEKRKINALSKVDSKNEELYSKQLEETNQQLNKQRAERKAAINVIQSEIRSIDQLRARNSQLLKERNKLDLSQERNKKRLQEINIELNKNNKIINENSSVLEKNKMNIGNYSSALDAIRPGMGGFITGFKGMIKASLAFIATPLGAVIAALVVAFKAFNVILDRNQDLQDRMRISNAASKNALEELIATVRDGTFEFQRFGEAFEQAINLEKAKIQLERTGTLVGVLTTKLQKQIDLQKAIADDATRSLSEREAAANKAVEFETKVLEAKLKLAETNEKNAKKEFDIAKAQNRITDEVAKKYSDAAILRINAEKELEVKVLENQKRINEIKLDSFEQELDYILDVSDKRKTANEKLINDDKLTFQNREKILTDTKNLLNQSFKEQIALFEQFHNINIDTNKLISLNNKEAFEYAESLGMSERATNRLLEVIRERIAANSDLSESEKKIIEDKKASIVEMKEISDEEIDAEITKVNKEADAEIEAANRVAQALIENEQRLREEDEKTKQQRIDNLQQIAAAAISGAQKAANTIFEINSNQRRAEYESRLELINQTSNSESEAAQKKRILDRNMRREEKQAAIKQAILNGALAITNILATVPKFDFGVSTGLLIAAAIAETASQVAVIKSQKFKEGGHVSLSGGTVKSGTFGGNYHSSGGTILSANGVPIAEVEKDENFYVLKRNASNEINRLSNLNEAYGGRPFKNTTRYAQDGGEIDTNVANLDRVVDEIRNLNIFVKVADINKGQNNVSVVENNATI